MGLRWIARGSSWYSAQLESRLARRVTHPASGWPLVPIPACMLAMLVDLYPPLPLSFDGNPAPAGGGLRPRRLLEIRKQAFHAHAAGRSRVGRRQLLRLRSLAARLPYNG